MYSEKSFKNYIFLIQVKRLFFIILLSVVGATLGILIGKFLESTIQVSQYNNVIIAGTTIVFFLISILCTAGTGKEVQDAYWKIAVLRKLTVIQKDLEYNNVMLNGKKIITDYKGLENIKEEVDVEENDKINSPISINKKSKNKSKSKHSKEIDKEPTREKKNKKKNIKKQDIEKTLEEKKLEEKIDALDDLEDLNNSYESENDDESSISKMENIEENSIADSLQSIENNDIDDRQENIHQKRKTIKKPEIISSK